MKINYIYKYLINIKKYLFRYLIIGFFVGILFSPFAFADSTSNTPCSFGNSVPGSINLEIYSLSDSLVPLSPLTNKNCNSANSITLAGNMENTPLSGDALAAANQLGANPSAYVPGGGYGLLAYVAYNVSKPVVSTHDSVTYVASNFSPTVSAQTSALEGLSPVLEFQGILRNVAYSIIVVALLISGLLIIIQNKNQKQGNVTAATSIANIITIFIFITISYPIAGIIIDLVINLGNGAIASLLDPFINASDLLRGFYTQGSFVNIFTVMGDFQRAGVSSTLVNILQNGLSNLSPAVAQTGAFFNNAGPAGSLLSLIIGIFLQVATAAATSFVNSSLILAIISFTLFILIFRIVFTLLGAFIQLIIYVMFAPIILISGAFPGQGASKSINGWIRNIIGASLVFPSIFLMLLLAAIFLNLSKTNSDTSNCYYDNTDTVTKGDQVPIGGTLSQQFNESTGKVENLPATSKYFDTSRPNLQNVTPPAGIQPDQYANIRNCFPKLLPPKFNFLPAPIGYLGGKFEIDDFTRFALGFAFIILAPSVPKIIQGGLGIKPSSLSGTTGDALAGLGIFSGFVKQIPVIGKPIGDILGNVQGAIK